MRSVLWVVLTLIFGLAMFWAGVVVHFPGTAVSRYIESRLNRDPRMVVRLTPAEMDWNRVRIPRISIQSALPAAPGPWVALKDAEIPISLGLMSAARAHAGVGTGGRMALAWSWDASSFEIDARDVALEDIPALDNLPSGRITGRLRLSGTLTPAEPMPEGTVEGRIDDLLVSEAQTLGLTAPPLRMDEAQFSLRLGREIQVTDLSFSGDLSGRISGTIVPRPAQPEFSRLDLQVDLAPRPEWVEQWGEMAPVMQSFLDNGRLTGRLLGTPARPNFRKNGGR